VETPEAHLAKALEILQRPPVAKGGNLVMVRVDDWVAINRRVSQALAQLRETR
jgi:hypothetical protein